MELREDFLIETLNPDMGYFFRSQKKLYETKTQYQDLEIHELPRHGRMLRLDGVFQTSEKDEFFYHEPLAHVPGITIDGPETALVIGGGDGGAAEEILKYPTVKKVVMVELDAGVVEACRQHIPSISAGAFSDPRLSLRIEDGLAYVKSSQEKFDHILLDLTDPFGPSIELYTREFYLELNRLLTDRGLLSLHIESPITRPELFSKLYHTLRSVFPIVRPMTNYVPLYGTLWGFAIAGRQSDPLSISKEEIQKRLSKFGIKNLQFYNPDMHHALLSLPNYILDLLKTPQEPLRSGESLPVPAGSKRNLRLVELKTG
ncbi:MAG: polyamine aminopropyltransferase [Leptospiraceae bacterium]|nr:polyamine aminopropyltransferase [Leptospiraceae bacterium]MDW8305616.1 polyamine aminopropyltransferase [Leptospiraceae bacterium]